MIYLINALFFALIMRHAGPGQVPAITMVLGMIGLNILGWFLQ